MANTDPIRNWQFVPVKYLKRQKIDLSGQRFGRLWCFGLAGAHPQKRHQLYWMCICDCDEIVFISSYALTHETRSCGCLRYDTKPHLSHGQRHTPIYKAWSSMKTRCFNKNADDYSLYGGRGITVCERWLKFENFFADMNPRPLRRSLDRIDVNGPYSPENCRWATWKEQNRNRRNNKQITYQGETHTLVEWAEIAGLHNHTLGGRLRKGWDIERAMTTPTE